MESLIFVAQVLHKCKYEGSHVSPSATRHERGNDFVDNYITTGQEPLINKSKKQDMTLNKKPIKYSAAVKNMLLITDSLHYQMFKAIPR